MPLRRLIPLLLVCLAALPAAPAAAAGPPGQSSAAPMRLIFERAYAVGAQRVALHGQPLRLKGIVDQYTPGQMVSVEISTGARRLVTVNRTVEPVGQHGEFTVDFRALRIGRVTAAATTVPQSGQPSLSARSYPVDVFLPLAAAGARGLRVRFLQQRLAALHYAVPRTGYFDAATARAVLAYRKVNHLPRTFSANRAIFGRLALMRGGFAVRFKHYGRHVEADLSRQVLVLINPGGRVFRIYHMASGKASTPTVLGTFRFYWKTPGTNSLGMVHSSYFIGGYAIHGYRSVPLGPASHGCLRIPIPNARFVHRWIHRGDRIGVYP